MGKQFIIFHWRALFTNLCSDIEQNYAYIYAIFEFINCGFDILINKSKLACVVVAALSATCPLYSLGDDSYTAMRAALKYLLDDTVFPLSTKLCCCSIIIIDLNSFLKFFYFSYFFIHIFFGYAYFYSFLNLYLIWMLGFQIVYINLNFKVKMPYVKI